MDANHDRAYNWHPRWDYDTKSYFGLGLKMRSIGRTVAVEVDIFSKGGMCNRTIETTAFRSSGGVEYFNVT